jgi:hypothetical protein
VPFETGHDGARSISQAEVRQDEIDSLEAELARLDECSASWSPRLAAEQNLARIKLKQALEAQRADYASRIRVIEARLAALG